MSRTTSQRPDGMNEVTTEFQRVVLEHNARHLSTIETMDGISVVSIPPP